MTRTLSRLFLYAALAAVLGSFGGLAQAVDYVAIDLNPSGYTLSAACGVAGSQQIGFGNINGNDHALLWNGTANGKIDLNPGGYSSSRAEGISGLQQVGYGVLSEQTFPHALLWNGSATDYIDLHPTGTRHSMAYGTCGTQQVGEVNAQAILWNGSADNYVMLHPTGFSESMANATDGTRQVGEGFHTASMVFHALLWSGTASATDLHPIGFFDSYAKGICGEQQVGCGNFGDSPTALHALLWYGSAASTVDLNPTGYNWSQALGTNGLQQVGQADSHAFVWNGSANNYVDLHQFLPSGYSSSCATSIDAQGNIVGYAYTGNVQHAMIWSPVPEPSAFVLLGIGAVGLIVCRLRRKAG